MASLFARPFSPPRFFGALLALFGVLVLSPDTLLVRLSGYQGMALLGWRGLLMGTMLILVWLLARRTAWRHDLAILNSLPGWLLIIFFAINAITFAFAITITAATTVLTAMATMPLFIALLSVPVLGERISRLTWLAMALGFVGMLLVIGTADSAVLAPAGSPLLGGVLGIATAAGLAVAMVICRRFPALPVLPSSGLASLLAGLLGLLLAGPAAMLAADQAMVYFWLILMAGLLLPLSFGCLMIAPKHTSATTVGLIMLLESIFGPLWVWFGTGERPGIMMMAGAVLVLGGLAIHLVGSQQQMAAAPQDRLGGKA